MIPSEDVYLQCIRENSKLRVRIITNDYFQDPNCQFPKALRAENQIYRVPAKDIRLVETRYRDFYRIGKKNIRLVEENIGQEAVQIYTTEEDDTCCVCLDNKKYYVYFTCGHWYVCRTCHLSLVKHNGGVQKCVICRAKILKAIPFHEIRK